MLSAGWRHAVATLFAVAMVVWASPSWAAGSVKMTNTTVEESDGSWKLKFTIDYGKMPHLAHVSMTFSFKQTAIYERSLTDDSPDTPVERTVVVHNAEPLNVPSDVDFSDVQGKLFQVTKYGIKLTRDADFEAGEYELTVKEANGRKVGGTLRIKLKGKNKIINRKAMDFSSSAPKPKPKSDPEPVASDVNDDGSPVAAEDRGPDLSDIPDVSSDDGSDAAKVEPKQGGCGCEVVQPTETSPLWIYGLAGLAVLRRRRREEARRA
jgi:hypothetical protein